MLEVLAEANEVAKNRQSDFKIQWFGTRLVQSRDLASSVTCLT